MNEPISIKPLPTPNGGGKEEKRSQEQWKQYKLWYNAQPGNRRML